MPRYCANLKAIRYESMSLNRIVADKSHRIVVALGFLTYVTFRVDYIWRSIKADFLSWQKSLAYSSSLRIFADNFFCYHRCSEYSLLGCKFSTNLLFAASKCHVTIQRQWQFEMFKMAKRSDGCSGEKLLAPCTRKKTLQRKMTKDCYWIGVQDNIGMLSRS